MISVEAVVLAAAVLTAVVAVFTNMRKIWDGGVMTLRWVTDRIGLPSKVLRLLESQGGAIREIQAELKPNGGTSLRDAVNEIRHMASVADVRSHLSREVCPYAMYECAPDGKCIWVNEALCQLFGLDAEDALGYGWLQSVSDAERSTTMFLWQEAVVKDIPWSTVFTIVNQRTGAQVRCRTRATSYKMGGVIILYSGTVIPEKQP